VEYEWNMSGLERNMSGLECKKSVCVEMDGDTPHMPDHSMRLRMNMLPSATCVGCLIGFIVYRKRV
jgi:hypothetical protein